ncbi:ElaA protein [Cnuella takakiae]|uniref:ElaA protein n=1 Tax=Cnuella takakiae TaxID=1302690 RepID=A0A1M5CTX9_9BACT|nr:GNAT family N-acetyltransferase [Cnuella takakiae]OLY91942.1 GNAT family N-acetyltransferase [Cnuella takakiae]SHF58193.1 ElaA protein [Cnuella takakiae]
MLQWNCKRFEELSPAELYALLRLRSEVFVVEQNCVFLDMDNMDQGCWHLLGTNEAGELVAYTRLVPPGHIYPMASIGRVVSAPSARRTGAGRELMQESIKKVYDLFGKGDIKIGAQYYLKNFYASFGFEQVSDIYLEDGIEHIYMILKAS